MRCLVVRQPWAELIASGRKTVELRTWTTSYRGQLLILAAHNRSRSADALKWRSVEGPQGFAVALVELVDVTAATVADELGACCMPCPGEYGWRLANVRRVQHVATKGRLGLYAPPAELVPLFATAC